MTDACALRSSHPVCIIINHNFHHAIKWFLSNRSIDIYTVFQKKRHSFSFAKTWVNIIRFQQFLVAAHPRKFATKM